MTLVGFLGILLGLLAWPFAVIDRTRVRVAAFAAAFLLHVGSAFVYYIYVQTASADTALYYYDPFGQYAQGFASNTAFIIYVVQGMKELVGGTYLDYFLVFQALGFIGIALLMRSIEEIYQELETQQPTWAYLLPFLPGLHFWTSAIGKDAPLFTACCLAIWAVMQIRRRYLYLVVAILLMLIIRPHIALITIVAVGWALLADRTTHPFLRGLLILGSFAGLIAAAATMRSTFQIDVTSADSMSDFLATRDNFQLSGSDDLGNTAVLNAPYPLRVLSLLFRPLFIDATGAFGYIASLENVILLVIFGLLGRRLRLVFSAIKAEPFVRYAAVSSVGITLALAIDYYNVGLGLRQKTMIVPGVIIVFVTIAAIKAARQRADQSPPGVLVSPVAI